ncbi:H393 [Gammaproteobacteria bacterium]
MTERFKLNAVLDECRLHAEVLNEALAEIDNILFDEESITHLSTMQRRLLDQIAYRYAKLQDTIGEKLLPGILDLIQEPLPEKATFIEKLWRLERLGVIESANLWKELRELRNQIAHEYHDQPKIKVAVINRFLHGAHQIIGLWQQIQAYVNSQPYLYSDAPIYHQQGKPT